MDGDRFDELVRALGSLKTRRSALRAAVVGIVGAAASMVAHPDALANKDGEENRKKGNDTGGGTAPDEQGAAASKGDVKGRRGSNAHRGKGNKTRGRGKQKGKGKQDNSRADNLNQQPAVVPTVEAICPTDKLAYCHCTPVNQATSCQIQCSSGGEGHDGHPFDCTCFDDPNNPLPKCTYCGEVDSAACCPNCGAAGSPGPNCCIANDVGFCTDFKSDEKNCGACGKVCAAGETCCGGVCTNVQTDPANCSECGKACASRETCKAGVCTACIPKTTADCPVDLCGPLNDGCGGTVSCTNCPKPNACQKNDGKCDPAKGICTYTPIDCPVLVCQDNTGCDPLNGCQYKDSPAGTVCKDGVCDGEGNCIGCLEASDCPKSSTPCKKAICTKDFTCGFENVNGVACPDGCCGGGTCGVGLNVCVSNNTCVAACANGQIYDPKTCTCVCNATSCAKGCCNGATCVPYAQQGNTTCGTAGATCGACQDPTGNCNDVGICVACDENSDCGTDTTCRSYTCNLDGTCDHTDTAIDTPCKLNGGANGFCDGIGTCVPCNTAAQCGTSDTCITYTCNANTCGSVNNDGVACGTAAAGCCSGGLCDADLKACGEVCIPDASCCTDSDCGTDTDCTTFTCNPNGSCTTTFAEPGTICDENGGQVCDGSGVCVECVDAAQCDDGDLCTIDTCNTETNTCVNTPVTCDAPANCETEPGTCNPQTGTCSYPAVVCNDAPICQTDTGATCNATSGACEYQPDTAQNGVACGTGTVCCNGNCLNNTCPGDQTFDLVTCSCTPAVCQTIGGTCTGKGQGTCCDGLECDGGICINATCSEFGDTCDNLNQCCLGLVCYTEKGEGVCGEAPPVCTPRGESCTTNDCCNPNDTCAPDGQGDFVCIRVKAAPVRCAHAGERPGTGQRCCERLHLEKGRCVINRWDHCDPRKRGRASFCERGTRCIGGRVSPHGTPVCVPTKKRRGRGSERTMGA